MLDSCCLQVCEMGPEIRRLYPALTLWQMCKLTQLYQAVKPSGKLDSLLASLQGNSNPDDISVSTYPL